MAPAGTKILVVEDDIDLRDLLVYHLKREGFRVLFTSDGFESLQLARREQPQVILLDLMLEGLHGLNVCQQIKGEHITVGSSVIVVSASVSEDDVLRALSLGADDYVRKPFSPKEVVARVKTVLRRGAPAGAPSELADEVLCSPPLTLNQASHEVTLRGTRLTLTATEFRLLHFLMRNAGRVFTRTQLLAQVSEQKASATGRNIDVHVRSLRRKLGDDARVIDTSRGVGYRFRPASTNDAD